MENTSTQPVRTVGAGSVVVAAVMLAGLVAAQASWNGKRTAAARNTYVIRMVDYAYEPSHMVWHVGQTVTLTFINGSDAHPGKPHEWMVGRTPNTEDSVFGPHVTDGFKTPFFDDVKIEVVDGAGLSMLMAGGQSSPASRPRTCFSPARWTCPGWT